MKRCGICLVNKDERYFYNRAASGDGLSSKCSECDRNASKKWRTKNPEKAKAIRTRWCLANNERNLLNISAWRKKNPINVARASLKYRKKNAAYYAFKLATRRAAQKNAIPKWANMFFISEIYDLSKKRTDATGLKWNVDHIVPIQSKLVCGLHVENNLQVITERDNFEKKNHYWPDMP